jgi:hypothetical protein
MNNIITDDVLEGLMDGSIVLVGKMLIRDSHDKRILI